MTIFPPGWSEVLIVAAIVLAAWRLDSHFVTRRELMLQLDLIRRDIRQVTTKLGCDDCHDRETDNPDA
jgi:hypothetical protein